MADGERCGTCRYWKTNEDGDEAGFVGVCRRYPPAVVSSAVELMVVNTREYYKAANGEEFDDNDLWYEIWDEMKTPSNATQPGTRDQDWCGEYRAKDAAAGCGNSEVGPG